MCYEQKEVQNGVAGEGLGLGSSGEDESRVDDAAFNPNNGPGGTIQVHDGFQISQQQQPQGSVVRWERFLPIRSLKVLLVENDDSTRHVVSALARNCGYEVTAVANSLQAWKILQDLTNHIDIVLTEVEMPIVSGIGLLCKIMMHKTLKNIPVIMMSSKDSMGIVFRCLSKGAVDFLVKPLRKNELKNLWQHVWRRCHSSSGSDSGSESGTQTKKSAKSKGSKNSDDDSSSGDELENGSNGLSIRDGSDNGSGIQGSWTKKGAEVDSPQPISPPYQLADDSICAQVIHTKPESFSNGWLHRNEPKDGHEQDEQPDDVATGKGLEIQAPEIADLKCDCQREKISTQQTSKKQIQLPEVDSKPFDNRQLELDNENLIGQWRDQATSILSANANVLSTQAETQGFDTPSGPSDISRVKETQCLELTLKRMQVEDDRTAANEDCNILRHSIFSAFSKYNTASSANQGPTGNVGSCSPLGNSSVAMKTETMQIFPPHSNDAPLNQQSNGSSNNNDMASTAKNVTSKPEALNDKSEPISASKPIHPSAFQALQNGRVCSSHQVLPEKTDDTGLNSGQSQLRGSHNSVRIENHHHHHHHHHHYHQHDHNMQLHQSPQDHNDLSFKNMAAAAPQCGSSNVFDNTNEGNVGNYSVNGSATGSNHGSNGQNGSCTVLNAGVTNLDSDNGAAGCSGVGGITERNSGNVVDEVWAVEREAVYTKFRQKRKERDFGKRVRYQSQKKLAGHRPHVREQFVRQIASDAKSGKDSASNGNTSEDNSSDNLR